MIAVVDSGGANITSVMLALRRLQKTAQLTSDPKVIQQADHVILPGVGAAHDAMQKITQAHLCDVIKQLQQPVLGICLGMQLLYQHSMEGDVHCLGVMEGEICALPEAPNITIPHMGWNQLTPVRSSRLLYNIPHESYVYFVHSYAAPVNDHTIAQTTHGQAFCAIAEKDNFCAMQFHPERSGAIGLQLLKNFLE